MAAYCLSKNMTLTVYERVKDSKEQIQIYETLDERFVFKPNHSGNVEEEKFILYSDCYHFDKLIFCKNLEIEQ